MTVPALPRRSGPFLGNGANTLYPFTFKVFAKSDVMVVTSVAGIRSVLTLDVDYGVTLNVDQDVDPGGTVTYPLIGSPLAVGSYLGIAGALPYDQTLDLPGGGNYSPFALENALDRLLMQIQQVAELASRALVFGVADTGSGALPQVADRKGRLLGFDPVTGAPFAALPTAGDATSLALDLLNQALATKGAGQIGFGAAVGYAAGTLGRAVADLAGASGGSFLQYLQAGTGAQARSVQSRLRDSVSAFDFMTAAQIADVQANTALLDVTAALQAAITAHRTVYLPIGTYKISAKLNMGAESVLIGQHEKRTILLGSHAGVMLEYPVAAYRCKAENILFDGAGCTGIAVNPAGGTLQGYLIEFQLESCHFSHLMAYGINADLIFFRGRNSSFGYEGSGGRAGTMCGIRSFSVSSNFTNINRLEGCIFHVGTASPGSIAVQLSGGAFWLFDSCDWEQCGRAVQMSNISFAKFINCWFEGNVATTWLVDIGASIGPIEFELCNFPNNTTTQVIQWNSNALATDGLVIRLCNFGVAGTGYPVFDNGAGSYLPDAGGKLVWDNNRVTGGNALNRLVSGYSTGMTSKVRAWFICDTSGAGSIVASSHPNISSGTRSGAGDLSVSLPFPIATALNKACVLATSQSGQVLAFCQGTTQNVRVQAKTAAGVAADAIVSVVIFGA